MNESIGSTNMGYQQQLMDEIPQHPNSKFLEEHIPRIRNRPATKEELT